MSTSNTEGIMKTVWRALDNPHVGAESIVSILMDARCGLELRSTDDDCDAGGCTPLLLSVVTGRIDVAEALLDAGADVATADDEFWQTPLHVAADMGRVSSVQLLIAHGAAVSARQKDGLTPLHLASNDNQPAQCAQYLIDNGADVDASNGYRNAVCSPLHNAATFGHCECVRILCSEGAIVDTLDSVGRTPLHLATIASLAACVELLLCNMANVRSVDGYGKSPLHYAAFHGSAACVEFLINRGSDVNATDFDQKTPLHHAVRLRSDKDLNWVFRDTAAAASGRYACLELLVAAGADLGMMEVSQSMFAGVASECVKLLAFEGVLAARVLDTAGHVDSVVR